MNVKRNNKVTAIVIDIAAITLLIAKGQTCYADVPFTLNRKWH